MNDHRGLAPHGFRCPLESDFDILLKGFGGEGVIAFHSLIAGGVSNFSALLGGWQNDYGFYYLGEAGAFWSLSQDENHDSLRFLIRGEEKDVIIDYDSKESGYSVRCIKN